MVLPWRWSSTPKSSKAPVYDSNPSMEDGIRPGGLWNLKAQNVITKLASLTGKSENPQKQFGQPLDKI